MVPFFDIDSETLLLYSALEGWATSLSLNPVSWVLLLVWGSHHKLRSLLWSDIWSVSTACSSITHPQDMCLLMKQMARTDASLLTNPVSMIHHQTEGLWASCTMDAKNIPSIVFLLFLFHPLLKFVLYPAWPHLCSCARLLRESP